MTDRLTPGMLRDLADMDEFVHGPRNLSKYLREEAARREAEAKPCLTCKGKYGQVHNGTQMICAKCGANIPQELGRTPDKVGASASSDYSNGEREGPDSAAAPCETCNDDPYVCAEVPGLRHCEKAQREDKPAPAADELGGDKFAWAAAYERTLGLYHDMRKRTEAAEARADRLAAALGLILPLAKGYVAANGDGGNREYINIAESAIESERGNSGE